MKIALFSPSWPPSLAPNGISTYAMHQAQALRELGHEVVIAADWVADDASLPPAVALTRRRSLADRIVDSVSHRLDPTKAFQRMRGRAHARTLRELHASEGFDIYETDEAFGSALWVARALPVPTVVRLHGPWFLVSEAAGLAHDSAQRARVDAERDGIAAAAALSAPSQFVLDCVRSRYGLELPHASVIPNGVPLPLEQWSGTAADPARILFVGRFDRLKGADVVLRAFGRLAAGRSDVTLDFVGPVDRPIVVDGRPVPLDEFLRSNLAPDAARRVRFAGFVKPGDILQYRRQAAVTVVASRYETFPMTMIEAMAFGSPVVCTRAAAMPEAVQDGRNGRLFAPEDADDLARVLLDLLEHPHTAASLGAQARLDCMSRYSADVIARRTADFYAQTLARTGSTASNPAR